MYLKPIITLCILFVFQSNFSQKKYRWINKEESENYVARHECSFVQSGNSFIMFGGRESARQLDIYDYAKNSWRTGASAPIEFNHFQATSFQGLVWVVGAFQTNNYPNEIPASHVYIYNPALDVWIQGPEIPQDRRRGGAGLVIHEDKFYLVAGNTKGHNGGFVPWLDVYDPVQNTWKSLADAPRPRDHFNAAIYNEKIYCASGRLSGGEGGTFKPLVPQVDIYDIKTKTWKTLPRRHNIPTVRAGAAVCIFNDALFVIGGEGDTPGPAHATVEAFDFKKGKWQYKKPLKNPRHGTQAIVSGDGIYIAGGSPVQAGGRQRNMEVYGLDNPQGEVPVASNLVAPEELVFSASENEMVMEISNTNGNTANFIKDIHIADDNATIYVVEGITKDRLLKVGDKMKFAIKRTRQSNNSKANLVITYDDGKQKMIVLTKK